MRYAVDWKKYNERVRSGGRFKAMGRFPTRLLYDKAKELVHEYCRICLLAGFRMKVPIIDAHWLRGWMHEYGVTMRMPNRKFKVPKWVLEQRLEVWWLNLARVRALCIAIFGYDRDQENWDQSPFHRNESGSKSSKSLAVAGQIEVPLIEGHTDTRARWTANLSTFSNKARIEAGDFPYAEFMFKADGELLQTKLQAHLRERGYPAWASTVTSEKASYKEADVLNFLDRHLPAKPQWRQWRIIQADDFSAHKTDNVRRLCWSRGYVLMIKGGGQTPVTQTCDTDLNQHVRREYVARESGLILEKMQRGIVVPAINPTECIDIMMDVLSDKNLHLHAADGYLKTGSTVKLDGAQDDEIKREAGQFFRELGMREKIDRAVALVQSEVKANRLTWTYEHVQRLISPYPSTKYDKILNNIGEHHHLDVGDDPQDAEQDEDEVSDFDAAVAAPDGATTGDVTCSELAIMGEAAVAAAPHVEEAPATALHDSEDLIDAYTRAMDVLNEHGAVTVAVHVGNEKRKEMKRQRLIAKEDPAVAGALVALKAKTAANLRRAALSRQDSQRQFQRLVDTRKETAKAVELLNKRKRDLISLENVMAASHSLRRYDPTMLGQGKKNSGGAGARKLRYDVLHRMTKLGGGLSAGQQTDWAWFHEAWDAKMAEEHAANWGGVFSGWMQQVLDDIGNGIANAFSVFVEAETRRCFGDTPMLILPAVAASSSVAAVAAASPSSAVAGE